MWARNLEVLSESTECNNLTTHKSQIRKSENRSHRRCSASSCTTVVLLPRLLELDRRVGEAEVAEAGKEKEEEAGPEPDESEEPEVALEPATPHGPDPAADPAAEAALERLELEASASDARELKSNPVFGHSQSAESDSEGAVVHSPAVPPQGPTAK